MLSELPVADQLAAVRDDPLRVLVVGAGIAGVTLTQLLRRRGLHPVLVERAAPQAEPGYLLGLLPLVDPVMALLGRAETYADASVRVDRYRLRDRRGRRVRDYCLPDVLGAGYRGISRADLLRVLTTTGGAVTTGTTVAALHQDEHLVRAALATRPAGGTATTAHAELDLVVGADGMHSTTRGWVVGADQVSGYDTGWGGWVGWAGRRAALDRYEELWGAGFFVGSYPVPGRVALFVAGPLPALDAGPAPFVARVRDRTARAAPHLAAALDGLAAGPGHLWRLADRRSASWSRGRVVLLGDAAAGFLPTAGMGAAMAMESAAVLLASLAGVDRGRVASTLRSFEQVQRPRVEAAQASSRSLARLMFRPDDASAALRDLATRVVPATVALRPLRRLLADPPDLRSGPAARF